MNISALSFLGINNNSKTIINNNPHFGIKLKNQINKDTVSFSGNTSAATSPIQAEEKKELSPENLQMSKDIELALKNNQDERALNILGYKTSIDDRGKITIEGNYNPSTRAIRGKKTISLNDLRVNENTLLRNVVAINGEASFSNGFHPDHYIATYEVKANNAGEQIRIKKELIMLNPFFLKFVDKVKQAHSNNNNLEVLKRMGYCASADIDGGIKIDGNLTFQFPFATRNESVYIDFNNIGIDEGEVLKDVKEISGNLFIPKNKDIKLQNGIKIAGRVYVTPKEREQEVFSNYKSAEEIFTPYKKLPLNVISTYIDNGIIKPTIRTNNNTYYFDGIDTKTKGILGYISKHRGTILTSEEIQEKYDIRKTSLNQKIRKGELLPYLIEGTKYNHLLNSNNYLYDITDERNKAAIDSFEVKRVKSTRAKESGNDANGEFAQACIRNSKNFENTSTKSFPASCLEELGYGTKADLLANCGLRINARAVGNYILNNSSYDISTPTMMDILANAKAKNPSLINIKKLLKLLGENAETFKQAVIDDKLNIITDNPYRLTSYNDYCIDITDKKNCAFLRTIQDENFQNWLQERVEAKEIYTKNNEQTVQEFLNSKELSRLEERRKIQDEVSKINQQRAQAAKEKAQAAKQRAIEFKKMTSLRSTIAWTLSPNTRATMGVNINPYIKDILSRKEELKTIEQNIVSGTITYEKAQEQISELKLSQKEEISALTYFKKCWDIANSQEWKDAQNKTKEIIEIYKKEGLDGIENPELKEKLAQWEKIWGKP